MSSSYRTVCKEKWSPRKRRVPRRQRYTGSCGGVGGKFSHRRSLKKEKDCGWESGFQEERTACAETAWCVEQTVSLNVKGRREVWQRYTIQTSL